MTNNYKKRGGYKKGINFPPDINHPQLPKEPIVSLDTTKKPAAIDNWSRERRKYKESIQQKLLREIGKGTVKQLKEGWRFLYALRNEGLGGLGGEGILDYYRSKTI